MHDLQEQPICVKAWSIYHQKSAETKQPFLNEIN